MNRYWALIELDDIIRGISESDGGEFAAEILAEWEICGKMRYGHKSDSAQWLRTELH